MSFLGPCAELMRLHKPVGILNIFFPYMYGFLYIALTSNPTPPPKQTLLYQLPLLFFSGFILRSVGCAWNDIVDADLDRLVARTRSRPLARRAISLNTAYCLTFALLGIWIATLVRLLPDPGQLAVYAVPLTGMVIAYPYMKRITSYAQVWLGITLAWGVLVGAAIAGFDFIAYVSPAAKSSLASGNVEHLTALVADDRVCGLGALYLVYVTWSVIHDTVYAFQDYKDDKQAGVKSMALRLENATKPILWTLSNVQVLLLIAACICMIPEPRKSMLSLGILGAPSLVLGLLHCRGIFLVVAVLGNAVILALMVAKVDLGNPQDCARWFTFGSIWVGTTIGLGFLLEYISQVIQA